LKELLENNGGFKVDSFTDPIIALNSYRINFYVSVILDIKMPKMDGFALYTKIKEKDPKVKICFLTATAILSGELKKSRLVLGKTIGENYLFKSQSKMKI
jgi:CheY-like chemotaxis protein